VFVEENQQVCFWGSDAKQIEHPDPVIFQGMKVKEIERLEWYRECDRCSDFLIAMICWQAANGGLPYGAWAPAPEAVENRLREVMTNVWNIPKFLMFGKNGAVVCLVQKQLQVAAKTPGDLERIRQTFGLDWTINIDPQDS